MSQFSIVGGQVSGSNPLFRFFSSSQPVGPSPQTPQSTSATQNLSSVSLLSNDTVEAATKASTRGVIPSDEDLAGADPATAQQIKDDAINRQHGGGMSAAELDDFETLVSRLEGSKMRQAAQSNRARQRDTFAGGLASMMRNF